MTIDLLKLAKQSASLHKEVNCTFGKINVYHVPDAMVLSANVGRPEPEQPMVRMKTVTGFQDRLSKPGDNEYDEWRSDLSNYNEERLKLMGAIRLVSALKDQSYPDINKPPPGWANEVYNGNWPDNEILRKKIWLDFSIMSIRSDNDAIVTAIDEMQGATAVTEEMVNEVKKSSG